jgi:hypothetical protein
MELEEALDCAPKPLSMETVSAPESCQESTELPPEVMADGEALNEATTGAVLEQATVVVGVMVTLEGPVAVKVTYEYAGEAEHCVVWLLLLVSVYRVFDLTVTFEPASRLSVKVATSTE